MIPRCCKIIFSQKIAKTKIYLGLYVFPNILVKLREMRDLLLFTKHYFIFFSWQFSRTAFAFTLITQAYGTRHNLKMSPLQIASVACASERCLMAARSSTSRVQSSLQTRLQRRWQQDNVQVRFVPLFFLVSTLFVSEIRMRPEAFATVIPDMEKQGRMRIRIAWP